MVVHAKFPLLLHTLTHTHRQEAGGGKSTTTSFLPHDNPSVKRRVPVMLANLKGGIQDFGEKEKLSIVMKVPHTGWAETTRHSTLLLRRGSCTVRGNSGSLCFCYSVCSMNGTLDDLLLFGIEVLCEILIQRRLFLLQT